MPRQAANTPDKLRRMLERESPKALAYLFSLVADEGQKAELRMKAAESILDRACGKSGVPSGGAPATVSFEGELEAWSR